MFYLNKGHANQKDIQIFEAQPNTINSFEFVIYLLNFLTGLGVLNFGQTFQAGIILNSIIIIFFAALNYYSCFIYVQCVFITNKSSFENVWSEIFNAKTNFIPILAVCLECLTMISTYFETIGKTLSGITLYLFPHAEHFVVNHYFVLTITFLAYFFPLCATMSLKFIVFISFIEVILFFVQFLYVIHSFSQSTIKYGFNHDHRLKLFNVNVRIFDCLTNFVTAFLLLPLNFPGIFHISHPTQRRFLRSVRITVIITCVFYLFFGFFAFMIGAYNQDMYFNSNENESINFASRVVFTLILLLSIPCYLNQLCYILVNKFTQMEAQQSEIWIISALLFSLIGMFVSGFSDPCLKIMKLCKDVGNASCFLVLPSIMYIKAFRFTNKIHFIGCCFMIVFAIGYIALSVIHSFFHYLIE